MYSVSCNLQPHQQMPLNHTLNNVVEFNMNWLNKKNCLLKQILKHLILCNDCMNKCLNISHVPGPHVSMAHCKSLTNQGLSQISSVWLGIIYQERNETIPCPLYYASLIGLSGQNWISRTKQPHLRREGGREGGREGENG